MPFLAIPFPRIDPILFQFGPFDLGPISLGPFAIRWYALAYISGLVLGWWYMNRLLRTDRLWPALASGNKSAGKVNTPATKLDIDDLIIWLMLGVIVGGRLGYVVFYQPSIITSNPLGIFAVWQGGMSFHGGTLGVVIAAILFSWRRKLNFLRVGDLIAAATPFGLFFGRTANFINGELWGKVTLAPWGMVFPTGGFMPRHPSQLYEAALEGVVLFIVLRIATHRFLSFHRPGLTIGLFATGYGVARILVEFFRQPDAHIGYLTGGVVTMGMVLSLPMVLVGGVLIWRASDKAPDWLKFGPLSNNRKAQGQKR